MSAKERAAVIRADYKRKHGWTARDVSVTSDRNSIRVTIKNPAVRFSTAKRLAEVHESISRCEYSGEILLGGNTYVSVSYSHEAADVIKERYADVLNAADRALTSDPSDNSLHPIGDTGFLMGRGSGGYGRSLWKDHHLIQAFDAAGLATTLHTGLQG